MILYWRHLTLLGKLHFWNICREIFAVINLVFNLFYFGSLQKNKFLVYVFDFAFVLCHTAVVEIVLMFHLGPVALISVNFNHQLAYFTDQSDTTHVPHQPTAVV